MCPTCPDMTRLHRDCGLSDGTCPQKCSTTLVAFRKATPPPDHQFIKVEAQEDADPTA